MIVLELYVLMNVLRQALEFSVFVPIRSKRSCSPYNFSFILSTAVPNVKRLAKMQHVVQYAEYFVRPVAQLVERWTPGSESPGSRRSGARYMRLLTGMVCGRWQRPQPVEVSEWGGPCPAMWAR